MWYGALELILAWHLVVLDAWIEEVQKYDNLSRTISTVANYGPRHILPNTLNMHKYHGPKRQLDPLKLLDFDIVFTTYATVAAEFRRGSNILHNMNWFRIVLDEGRSANSLFPVRIS